MCEKQHLNEQTDKQINRKSVAITLMINLSVPSIVSACFMFIAASGSSFTCIYKSLICPERNLDIWSLINLKANIARCKVDPDVFLIT